MLGDFLKKKCCVTYGSRINFFFFFQNQITRVFSC